jgi:nucleoid DNA-binding protein
MRNKKNSDAHLMEKMVQRTTTMGRAALSHEKALSIIHCTFAIIKASIASEDRVNISDFGTFRRIIRNKNSGRRYVSFRPGRGLRSVLNRKKEAVVKMSRKARIVSKAPEPKTIQNILSSQGHLQTSVFDYDEQHGLSMDSGDCSGEP